MLVVLAFVGVLSLLDVVSGSTNIWAFNPLIRHDVYRDENPAAFWTLILLRLVGAVLLVLWAGA